MQIGTLAMACMFVLAAIQQPGTIGSQPEQQVRRASDAEVQAFLQSDQAGMARLWADEFVVTNPLNKLATRNEVLEMVRSGFLMITAYDRRVEYAHVYGETVILAGSETVTWGGKMPMAGKKQELRFTAVWMRRGSQWQEVVRHANIVPQT